MEISSGDTGDAPKRTSLKPTMYGLRRSCEPCRRRKKKCDGERACSRCLQTGEECTYSKRLWHLPDAQRAQEQRDPSRVQSAQVVQNSASGAALRRGDILSFKRCRLSASPATGLVGLQENAFLGDYFGCVGFLPLTTQSHIREVMVKIMLAPASRQRPTLGGGAGTAAGALGAVVGSGELCSAFGGSELPIGAPTCVFWCAVALGALVRGNPIESVASYTRMATGALEKSFTGPADAEVAKAWAILAYVYGFMGDLAKFQAYLEKSATFLTTSIERGSQATLPVGFAEIIQHREIANAGPHNVFKELESNGELESMCAREPKHPQTIGAAASEPELYQFVMRSFRAFEQAVFSKLANKNATNRQYRWNLELSDEGTGDHPHSHRNKPPLPHDIADAMLSVMADESLLRFERLQEAVDRPSIRAGVGGMMVNATLVFKMAGKSDAPSTLKRVERCVEVFARYPGLSRSVMGFHMAHMMMGALAALDHSGAREVYDRLRAAYNLACPRAASPAPPLEEWRGISLMCEDAQCRAIETLVKSGRLRAFSKSSVYAAPNENGGGDTGEEPPGVAGRSRGEPSATSIVPEIFRKREPFVPTPCSPGSSEAGCDLHSACDTSGGLSREGRDGTERWMEPTGGAQAASVAPAVNSSRCRSGTEVNQERGARGGIQQVVRVGDPGLCGELAPPDEALLMTEGLGEGLIDEMGDDETAAAAAAAADWLDVTHALLEEVNESGQACCR